MFLSLLTVDVKLLEGALATIRHARWFEENAFHTVILVFIARVTARRFASPVQCLSEVNSTSWKQHSG